MMTIFTPCSRPYNLPIIEKSIIDNLGTKHLRWIVVYDAEEIPECNISFAEQYCIKGGVSGNLQRNFALSKISDGWVYCLDDDNLIHPEFNLKFHIALMFSGYKGVIFPQELPDGSIRPVGPEHTRVCHIDQAQFVLERSIIDREYEQVYEADGRFIEDIYKRYKDQFHFGAKPRCYYNKLRP